MTRLDRLHPDCRTAWERGMTGYPPEEHIRDCDVCQEFSKLINELEAARGQLKTARERWIATLTAHQRSESAYDVAIEEVRRLEALEKDDD